MKKSKELSSRKELTLYGTIPSINDLLKEKEIKTLWEKDKILVNSIFSFSHNVSCSIKDKMHHLCHMKIVACKCFEFGQG